MTIDRQEALELHQKANGKIKMSPTVSIRNKRDIAMAYIQGGAVASKEILNDRKFVYEYTGKKNRLAIVSNGTSVLGMGTYGPEAALPMIEGKCLLYKQFGDIDSTPLCINADNLDDLMDFCRVLAPSFGAINIEDVKSPNDLIIVKKLRQELDIPIFCDDMHSSSVVILGSLINALKVVEKDIKDIKIVIAGAGTAAIATAELLLYAGASNVIVLNHRGVIHEEMDSLTGVQSYILDKLNPEGIRGSLEDAIPGADVLIGLTGQSNIFTADHVKKMAPQSIVFALSRPAPEIEPEAARAAGAAIAGCGLMEGMNTMPNLKVFPGITRGLLDVRATGMNFNIMIKAAEEYARNVESRRLSPDHITPHIFSDELAPGIAEVVAQSCVAEGLARIKPEPREIYDKTWKRLFGGHTAKY